MKIKNGISRREALSLFAAGALSERPVRSETAHTVGSLIAPQSEIDASRARRMQWWHAAKFGMFIHWGLYSVYGCHEWVMEMEGIPATEYEKTAKLFNPRPNAARDWAKLAKRAGMKYMVMTTKHHASIYQTDVCQPRRRFGSFSRKGNTLFLHVHYWPGSTIAFAGLMNKVQSAKLLGSGQKVAFKQDTYSLTFTGLPETAPDTPVTTIAMELDGEPRQDEIFVRRRERGTV